MRAPLITLVLATLAVASCSPRDAADGGDATEGSTGQAVLGPVDGRDLPPTDLDRVQEGMEAPDFTLASLDGPQITLSDYRGDQNVILVFYRGHW